MMMMLGIVLYVLGIICMALFVLDCCVEQPPPRTARTAIDISFSILLWPLAIVVWSIGAVWVVFDVATARGKRKRKTTPKPHDRVNACDQQNPVEARWCRRCGRPLLRGQHVPR